MCNYIDAPSVAPGWGCCACHTYNGLQRDACKACRRPRCVLKIPDAIARCGSCGFGARTDQGLAECPVCGDALQP